jgi:uncharacterized protein (TIGR03084 family)
VADERPARASAGLEVVSADLIAEHDSLDLIVAELGPGAFEQMTPSAGWTIADQLAHLAFVDCVAATAIVDPDRFAAHRAAFVAAATAGTEAVDRFTRDAGSDREPAALLASWRANRADLMTASATLADNSRVPWLGPSMSARSFLTARLMETWAHGQDIVDTVGATRPATDRLQHIARLGVLTRGWSYRNRGLEEPHYPVVVVLSAPSGERWSLGDPDATDRVEGPAQDFCLVVTQRRHLDDTAIRTVGDAPRDWLLRAQAFAGLPTDGPARGGRVDLRRPRPAVASANRTHEA